MLAVISPSTVETGVVTKSETSPSGASNVKDPG